ncbi:hypothetical protein L0668_15380 [Paraglaciecola aquimarina]|uniref:Uncharacterized protein n=1 Tax=Paraglaciecola algarum TaxID=3050085 RepID=A0ABS9D968_9ALTE|nr:hypothetical protein [Paraglaciecola sp. G1-23]MCF2949501.1 hypothetical protein [Paraglaciecola sp. G1-23]
MLNKLVKTSLFATFCLASFTYAEDRPILDITMHSEKCPESFYALPVLPQAKFCQQFSADLPASMSYHVNNDQQTAAQFYLEKMGQAQSQETLKGRIVLQYKNGNKIVIISADGNGSQIDILVKSNS